MRTTLDLFPRVALGAGLDRVPGLLGIRDVDAAAADRQRIEGP